MSEVIKCPVCGKAGILDYHKEEVVCPCCGTDLSIYKMLSDSQETVKPQETNNKNWKLATAASAAIAILALIFVFLPKKQEVIDNPELINKVELLGDSINSLTKQLNLAKQEIAKLKKAKSIDTSGNIYIVKKNDSPCKISRKLYGTESRYKEIEALITKPLQPGDTLKLK
jgi:hypothetical protein